TSDPSGNIFFITNNTVFKVDTAGTLGRVAGNARVGFAGDGGQSGGAQFSNPSGLVVDNAGNLYIADSGNNRIRRVNLNTGIITTIAGTGTPFYSGDNQSAVSATLNNPQGLAVDASGNLYIA